MKTLIKLFPRVFTRKKRLSAGVWTTKDGKNIHISKMEDSHLINTFNYVIKVARTNHSTTLSTLSSNVFAGILSGKITPESIDHMIYGDPERDAMQQPIMILMLEELYKRKLENSFMYSVGYLMPLTFEKALEDLQRG